VSEYAHGPECRHTVAWQITQCEAQQDRDACDQLLKAIFDRGLGQRQIARVTEIPLAVVQPRLAARDLALRAGAARPDRPGILQ
jgi:hypothetical protein